MSRADTGAASTLAGRPIRPLAQGAPASVFSVDVEDWYHANFRSAPFDRGVGRVRRVEQGVDNLLALLDDAGATATFFVLGCVAEEHPGLVARIAAAGHEIGCHGMQHDLVYEQSRDEFRRAVDDARKLLCDQSGQSVVGFRAPSWSITDESLWALDVLAACGFRYDSSIFPAANYLYGIAGAPTGPYAVTTGDAEMIEMPPSVVGLGGSRFGVGGGFYLRVLPMAAQRWARRSYARRGAPFVCYVHPREFDPEAWPLRLRLNWSESAIHRFRIGRVRARVAELLSDGSWNSFGAVLAQRGWLDPSG